MLNDILDAVTRRLDELFGDGFEIYTDAVRQGLKEPCFFVQFLEPSEKQVMGQRYFCRIDLCIQYFPGNLPEVLREFNRAADLLMDGMEYLTLADGSLVRGTERSNRPDLGEKQLTFFVSYHTFVIKQKEKEENMSDIKINHPKSEKGKVE